MGRCLSVGSRSSCAETHPHISNSGDASPSFATIRDAPKLHLITGGLWDVPSQGFVVNGEKINLSSSGELPFALDTGAYTGELNASYPGPSLIYAVQRAYHPSICAPSMVQSLERIC